MKNSIRRNLFIGYGATLILLIICSILSYVSIRNLLYSQQIVSHTQQVIQRLENVISLLKDAETGQRGFLITGETDFLQPYETARQKLTPTLSELHAMVSDNADQEKRVAELEDMVMQRLTRLAQLIEEKKAGKEPQIADLYAGKRMMDQSRVMVADMVDKENKLLSTRTSSLNKVAGITPPLILIASLISILITIYSFFKVTNDFKEKEKLQATLEKKDKETMERLAIIQNIAGKISAGDYETRVADDGEDMLGSLSYSLNNMAQSLQSSFTRLSEREWMQNGIAQLNEKMIGETDLVALAENTLTYITSYANIPLGTFYYINRVAELELTASVAVDHHLIKSTIKTGEGLAGQAVKTGKMVKLDHIEASHFGLPTMSGQIRPSFIIAFPIFHDHTLKGAIELASLRPFTEMELEFLKTAVFNIGIAIHSAKDHQRLQELLNETQSQSEELQAQHSELENINAELEAQAEKLQASEEELRVQQEELQQSNQELEERSSLLEEKNQLILERNIDIQRKAEELALSTKYKSEFLANMSHELRTPLNSILLLSRLLSENHNNNLNPEQIEYATVIQHSGKGLLTLIDEILDLSKIESGKMELQPEEVNVMNVTDDLRDIFAPMAKDKQIGFEIDIEKNVPSTIVTDRLRLDQVLRNLLSNAIKFTKAGSVQLKVRSTNKGIAFHVKDTGIGIPEDKQHTVFEAFQQADGSTRRQFGGTGLGLSISRELAKLLGGEVNLKSAVNEGSEFVLWIPVNINEVPKAVEYKQEEKPTSDPVPDRQVSIPNPEHAMYISKSIPHAIADDREIVKPGDKVILIVEDDTAFAKSLVDYTHKKGYKAITTVRGDEALELARKYMPTGILLDVQLPIRSGWEVMDDLKNDISTRPIPVHMMSSHEVKNKSLSKGAVDFINKPVAFEQLGDMFTRIEEALNRHPKKVLIVEENPQHAKALAFFLENYHVNAEISNSIQSGIEALQGDKVDCVILDMGVPAHDAYETLENVKKTPGMESLPIIIFTGKNLSHVEEMKIKQYADSIVIKTAHSYQRILDEVSLFLHLVEENSGDKKSARYKNLGDLSEVLRGKTVLVADDDVRNIFSLTKSLELYGMNVVSAIDGKDALKQLNEHPVDIVLMDMMMPEMDGYESTAMIRTNPAYRNLPVIAVTAKAMTGDREKCINAGASDYITKPVDIDQLLSLLRVWLYE